MPSRIRTRTAVRGLAVWLSTVSLAAACGGGGLGLVSTQDEVQFGREAHNQLTTEEYQVCGDCAAVTLGQSSVTVTQYVSTLGQELAVIGNPDRGASRNQIPQWTFTVLQSDEVNAFALPGGFVYVTTGLLAMVRNKAELAGILGHEVGHVTNYHGVERIEKFMIAQQLTALLFGSDAEMAQAVSQFLVGVDGLVSSQDDELEADRAGVQYAYRGQWNPLEMNNFFRDIEGMMGGPSDPISEVLSSHPPPRDRIAQVESESADLGVTADAPGLRKDDSQIPYASVLVAVQPLVTPAAEGTVAARIPENLRPYVHACTFDLKTRQMVHR